MNNQPLNALSAELRESDPLCLYVTFQRSYIELMLARALKDRRNWRLPATFCREPGLNCSTSGMMTVTTCRHTSKLHCDRSTNA